jgi:hypothetical protein
VYGDQEPIRLSGRSYPSHIQETRVEPMKPMEPMAPMTPRDSGPKWWPDDLGSPSTSGAQNGVRYAFFPSKQRLAIERDGSVQIYDSGEHQISGVSQQQGSSISLAFRSQKGDVNVGELKKLDL